MYDGYWTNYKELILGTPMSIRSKSRDRIITVPGDAMSVRSKSEDVRRVASSRCLHGGWWSGTKLYEGTIIIVNTWVGLPPPIISRSLSVKIYSDHVLYH